MKTTLDNISYKDTITINGRVVTINFIGSKEFAKEIKKRNGNIKEMQGVQGFATMENEIFIELRQYTLNWYPKETDWKLNFDRMAQHLWHEAGHIIEETLQSSTINGEFIAVIGENYYFIHKELLRVIENFKEYVG